MTLVADEGVDKSIVDALRASGHTVKYFAEAGAGSSDKDVLAAANETKNLLLTCDKDFGELVVPAKTDEFRRRAYSVGRAIGRIQGEHRFAHDE